MEALTKYWGFYLVATPDANDVGLRDLRDALELVARYREWVPDLKQVPEERRATQNEFNNQIASKGLSESPGCAGSGVPVFPTGCNPDRWVLAGEA